MIPAVYGDRPLHATPAQRTLFFAVVLASTSVIAGRLRSIEVIDLTS